MREDPGTRIAWPVLLHALTDDSHPVPQCLVGRRRSPGAALEHEQPLPGLDHGRAESLRAVLVLFECHRGAMRLDRTRHLALFEKQVAHLVVTTNDVYPGIQVGRIEPHEVLAR